MKLPIVKYGNPILRAQGKEIEQVDERIRTLTADMLETMQAANGVGLAAQQVGAALQLTVLDISQAREAHRQVEEREVIGKVVLTVPDNDE